MAILESDLSRETLDILKNRYTIYTEIPLYNRCIDAVLLKNEQLITIEFKIKDWRRAVRQIRTHLLAADYSYLCMPERKIPLELFNILKEIGIGLWLFNIEEKELNERLAPKHSYIQQKILKEKMLNYLATKEINSVYS